MTEPIEYEIEGCIVTSNRDDFELEDAEAVVYELKETLAAGDELQRVEAFWNGFDFVYYCRIANGGKIRDITVRG